MSATRPGGTARERVELMLSVLPWLAAKGGAPLVEVAERFGADPELLRRDLDTVFYDVQPVTGPDHMVEVVIDHDDDDFVTVNLPGYFEEPPQLDHSEALMLLAAGTARLDDVGSDLALAPALEKLAASLGPGASSAVRVDLGPSDPMILATVRRTTDEGRSLQIKYFNWSRDSVGERLVDPYAVRSFDGHWYVSGFCHDRQALRHFRLDRILSARAVGEPDTFAVPDFVEEPEARISEGGQLVDLDLPELGAWVISDHPVEQWRDDGDRVNARIRVHNERWLERLLLRLGPDATATDVATNASLAGLRATAANRILGRYRRSGEPPVDR